MLLLILMSVRKSILLVGIIITLDAGTIYYIKTNVKVSVFRNITAGNH